jgi:hypothetical protein
MIFPLENCEQKIRFSGEKVFELYDTMEQRTLRNVNNCLYTNVYSYLETSGGISYNPYLNVVHFFNTRVNLTSVAA